VITVGDAIVGARFLRRLPAFLRHPITHEAARRELRRRFAARNADFLHLARHSVYGDPASPYRRLLALAGCEYGDVERLVRDDGVEGALGALYQAGVYLTVDEFKGRRPVRRGSAVITLEPGRLYDRAAVPHIELRSSGSRGGGTPAPIDFTYIEERTVNTCLALHARGGAAWSHAVWGVPGSLFMVNLLELAGFGSRPVRWFSQVDPASPGLHSRYRWSTHVMRWGSLVGGVPLPRPEHVSLEAPLPIVRWVASVRRTGGTPHLLTYSSSAVRVCLAATRAGIDIGGTQFSLTGEPLTTARAEVIRACGAHAAGWYGSMESSSIGHACVAPAAPDDVHFLHDRLALIQPGVGANSAGAGQPLEAFFLSSIRPGSLFVLLNVSLGDQAVVSRRRCGCPMEELGWTTHLSTIRSYEKLTAGGMTFLDVDAIRVLEDLLPARFGGAPTDYQLVEEEGEDGRPRLLLLVHPALGPLDPEQVAETFLGAIAPGSGLQRVMGLAWRQASFPRVERRIPIATVTGKILHLHVLPARALTARPRGSSSAGTPGRRGT
jgi:hypothetical protein